MSSVVHGTQLIIRSPSALGIGAASFASGASKDIAESPTAIAGTPRKERLQDYKTTRQQVFFSDGVMK